MILMATRGMLHMNRLEEFKIWLSNRGYRFFPTKSVFEVLRASKGFETVILYKRLNEHQHFTVPSANVRLVRKFIEETKGGKNHGRTKEPYGSGNR